MRIKNKYLRNRHFRNKAWNKAKKIVGGEFSQKHSNPYWFHGLKYSTVEEQQKNHIKRIKEWWLRSFISGGKYGYFHAPRWYRQEIERPERRSVKKIIDKMLKDIDNVDDYNIPQFKHQADWDWF